MTNKAKGKRNYVAEYIQ